MNYYNKKTILVVSIFALMLNGCMAKNELPTKRLETKEIKSTWSKVKVSRVKKEKLKKDDCIDCYATVLTKPKPALAPNTHVLAALSYVNSSYNSYDTYSTNANTAIQVGAFRQYSGAKIYMKRYNALSRQYKVTIKTVTKKSKPLYRVRIEGFKNKVEAKKFMYNYGIRDAFVVRK